MAHTVLGVGYHQNEHEAVRREWKQYDVDFHFVHSTEEAVQKLGQEDYICITIFGERIDDVRLDELHRISQIPVVMLSQKCTVLQRMALLEKGVADFILNANQWKDARSSGINPVQYYLDLPVKGDHPITAVTAEEMFICLEHRSVEVRGQHIKLTPREFDILALLITHPKQVFTFDMLMELVWNEDGTYYTRKVIANHMSKLRNKLKVQPDVPDYIVSIYGVGYKFEAV